MKKYILLLLTVITLGCGSVQPWVSGSPRPAPLTDYTSYVVRVSNDGGHGSGFPFARVGDWTYVATAKHVAKHSSFWTLEWNQDGFRQYTYAEVVALSDSHDVAILKTSRGMKLLGISPWDPDYIGDSVRAVGYGADVYPPLTTIGRVVGAEKCLILHDAGIWFGFSGGPLINEAGGVIGINVLMFGDGIGPMSNRGGAEKVDELVRMLYKLLNPPMEEPDGIRSR